MAFIVSPLWVEKCIESGKCVDEMDFLICVDPTMFLKVKKPRLSTVKEEMGEKISSKKNKNLKKKEDDNDQENSDFNIDKTNFTEHELRDEFRIIFSSTQSTKKPFLYEACSSLPNTEIIFSHEDPVTHVVLDKPKRTLKVLFGIARGAWIVDSQWVLDAFSFGKFPNEEKYECSLWPGASISRRLRENNDGNLLLHRLKIFVFYNGQDPDLGAAISELVLLLGGILETNIDNCEICITSESCLENMNEGFMNSKTGESPRILRHEWLFDSISEYKLMPYDEYAILHVEDSAELDSPEV